MNRTISPIPFFPPRALIRAGLLFAFSFLIPFFYSPMAGAGETPAVRYLRGVHVLRTILPGDHWPPVSVPRSVRAADSTNALLMHRDRNFVLTTVAADLDAATDTGKFPPAGYYAAHAHALLGEHADAARTMRRYMGNASFRESNYLFLMRELHAASDYRGAREAAALWQALEPPGGACSEERLTYVWGGFFSQGLHRNAMEAVLSDPCASWRGQVYFARSCLALGDAEGAEERVKNLMLAYPDRERDIRLLWNRLGAAGKYP